LGLGAKIESHVMQLLDGTDKFLVGFTSRPGNKFSVFIDGDNGVSIEDCRLLSRSIENAFDRNIEDYELTVSSAGIDHPLKSERQFRKNTGREMKVTLNDGTSLEGILVATNADGIEIKHKEKKAGKEILKPNTVISFPEIKSAIISISFGK
jgi:ribosome maturation factor RimP